MAFLRSQGHTEQSSPELAQLVTMFGNIQRQMQRLRQMQMAQAQAQAQGSASPQQTQPQGSPLPNVQPIQPGQTLQSMTNGPGPIAPPSTSTQVQSGNLRDSGSDDGMLTAFSS